MAIARRELGSPDAPALVLVHGLGASGRALEHVAPLLTARFRGDRARRAGAGPQ